jgi:hypothetical protein
VQRVLGFYRIAIFIGRILVVAFVLALIALAVMDGGSTRISPREHVKSCPLCSPPDGGSSRYCPVLSRYL